MLQRIQRISTVIMFLSAGLLIAAFLFNVYFNRLAVANFFWLVPAS